MFAWLRIPKASELSDQIEKPRSITSMKRGFVF